MLRRRFPTLSSSNSIHSNLHEYESSEDEDLGLEEKEQERQLSKIHGEAPEAPISSVNQKRQLETDADIANALSNEATKKKRKIRVVLTEQKLIGGEGLIRIRHDFPTKLKYRQPSVHATWNISSKRNKERLKKVEIQTAARYASDLIRAYQEFAIDLMPNHHYKDTFHKIEDLGSKKIVRDYLDEMRQDICRGHLEKIHGKLKTERLLNELENGLTAAKSQLLESDGEDEMNNFIKSRKSREQPPRKLVTHDGNTSGSLPNQENENREGDVEEEEEARLDDVIEAILPKKDKLEKNEEIPKSNDRFVYKVHDSTSPSTLEDENKTDDVVDNALVQDESEIPVDKEHSNELNPKKELPGIEKVNTLDNDETGGIFDPDVGQGLRKSEDNDNLKSLEEKDMIGKCVASNSLKENTNVPQDSEAGAVPPIRSNTTEHRDERQDNKCSQQGSNASENLIQDFTQRPLVDDDHEPANECMIVEMSQRSETSAWA